jgi:hypothetical protein
MSVLRDLHRRWTVERRTQLAAAGTPRWLPWLLLPGAGLWAVDVLVSLPWEARCAAWLAWAAAAGAAIWRSGLRPQWRLSPLDVLRDASKARPKLAPYLVSGWELSEGRFPRGVSEELAAAHVAQAEAVLSHEAGNRLFPPRWSAVELRRASIAAAIALAAVLSARPGDLRRVLLPWREPTLEKLVRIVPGDADIPWGQPVTISASWTGAQRQGLELWLRSPSSPWRQQDWDSAWSWRVLSLTEPIEYRLRWRDLKSRIYMVRPVAYPHFDSVRITVRAPAYARVPPEVIDRAGDIEVLEGSRVEIEGKPDRPLRSAVLRVSNLPSGVGFSGQDGLEQAAFVPSGEGTFHWELEDLAGVRDPSPPAFRFKTTPDNPPTIELLSPAFDAEASPREPFRLTYEATDDYGLRLVAVEFRSASGASGSAPGGEWFDSPKREIGDVAWDLSRFPSGAELEYRLAATDTRGQVGRSRPAKVRIVDFEGQHVKTRQDALRVMEQLARLGEREQALSQGLVGLSSGAEAGSEMKQAQSDSERGWPRAASAMEELAKQLEQDPLANPGLQVRYRDLAERLKAAAQKAPAAAQSFNQKDWPDAAARHEELRRELEDAARSLGQGESLQTYQDLWQEGDRMAEQSRRLQQALEDAKGGKLGPEESRRLREAMQELQKRMEALAQAIRRMPKPQKQEAGRRKFLVPLSEAQSLASRLDDALRRGDAASARELSRKLADALGRVQRALADAQESMASEMLGEHPLSKKLQEAEIEWEKLVEAQSGLVDGIGALETARVEKKVELQKKLLSELAERQKAVRESAPAEFDSGMRMVEDEFRSGKLSRAETLLSSLSGMLAARPDGQELSKAEADILARLRAGVDVPADPKAYAGAAKRQREVRAQASQLEKMLSELPVDRKPLQTLGEAEREMDAAAAALDKPDGESGLKSAGRALELLQKGQEQQQRQQQQQSQSEAGLSQRPSGGGVRRMGGGRAGANTGYVELPSAKDYRPPPEMRQEIMKSLEERYPRSYEGVIKDYLKRLSQ